MEIDELWISVSNRLPNLNQKVLISVPIYDQVIISYFDSEGFNIENNDYSDLGLDPYYVLCNPSHWMPMPKPVKIN